MTDHGAHKTVLLAEDDKDIADLVSRWLDDIDLRVVTAADGEQAIAHAREHNPDLLILDLHMPVVDGVDAARRIRQIEALRAKPIIFMTAYGGKGIELFANIDGLGDGPIEYVTKPIDFDYLRELLGRLL
jgi:two-component system OmpR family response regulator